MTVTNTRVILHTPKTAGSSIRWPAMKIDGLQYSCQHCHIKMLPNQYKNMKKITFVRNPYDWYASRYSFTIKRKNHIKNLDDVFTETFSNDFTKDFNDVLPLYMNLTKAFENKFLLEKFKTKLKREVTNNYQCWLVSYWDNIDNITAESFENRSLYDWWLNICGVYEADAIYRIEDQHEYGLKKEFGENINIVHRNKTNRLSNVSLYNYDNILLVKNIDAKIFKKFGYEPTFK